MKIEDLIIKYLNRNLSAKESAELETKLRESKNQSLFKKYIKLQHTLNTIVSPPLDKEIHKTKNRIKRAERKHLPRKILKIAALFIFLIGMGGVWFYFSTTSKETTAAPEQLVKIESADGEVKYIDPDQTYFIAVDTVQSPKNKESLASTDNEPSRLNTITVPNGQNFAIVLSDGTQVDLNAGTSIKYPGHFNPSAQTREVFLDGEAFFQVKTDPKQPFIVNTKDLNIKVTGTRFVVSAYPEDQSPYAVLIKGKISAINPATSDSLAVTPGNKVFYTGDKLKSIPVSTEKYTGWLDHKLIFIDEPFPKILKTLERQFNIHIKNNYKELNQLVITASFEDNDLDKILKTFKSYKAFDAKKRKDTLIINHP